MISQTCLILPGAIPRPSGRPEAPLRGALAADALDEPDPATTAAAHRAPTIPATAIGRRLEFRRLLLELGVDPVHLGAEFLADHLDLVARLLLAHALEVLLAGAVLGDPLAGEIA